MKIRKIGIITYFHFYNYGTMLQAYALQHILSKLISGVDCEIINYKFGEKTVKIKLDILKNRVKRMMSYLRDLDRILTVYLYRNNMNLRREYFESFLKNEFKISSDKYIYNSDLESQSPYYDIYITGSDQTWSPKIGFNPALFLNFADRSAIKAAYAPSVGVTSFTESEELYLRENLAKYDYLSCRETIGAKLLSKITGKNVQVVLDPTLMVEVDEWRKITIPSPIKQPYILCYFLGHRSYCRDFVKQLKERTRYDVYFVPVSYIDCKKANNLLFDIGPAEFLGLIENAAFVCTDSFHGMCFSINFQKNFYAFVKHEGAIDAGDNSRIYDLLQRTGLVSRLLMEDILETDWQIEQIDYLSVNQLLKREKKISATFLHNILDSYA